MEIVASVRSIKYKNEKNNFCEPCKVKLNNLRLLTLEDILKYKTYIKIQIILQNNPHLCTFLLGGKFANKIKNIL